MQANFVNIYLRRLRDSKRSETEFARVQYLCSFWTLFVQLELIAETQWFLV